MNFDEMKKSRGKLGSKLKEKIQESENSFGTREGEHPSLFYPELDKKGRSSVVLRFMPPALGSDLPFVKVYQHKFKNEKTGKWLIANCPTTRGDSCPICAVNSEYWDAGEQDIARQRKRKINYFLNALIVDYPKDESRNGEMVVFRCGAEIFKMINEAQNPKFDDEESIDPWDLWEGHNFHLRTYRDEETDYIKYDASKFDQLPSPIAESDNEIKKIWESCHDLKFFVGDDQFRDWENLNSFLKSVTGDSADSGCSSKSSESAESKRQTQKKSEPSSNGLLREDRVDTKDIIEDTVDDDLDDLMNDLDDILDD